MTPLASAVLGAQSSYRLARIEGGSRCMPRCLSQPASTDLGRINLRMVARSPRHVRASKAHGIPLLAPEMMALTGLSLHKVGAAVGRRRSHRANDGQEPTGEHGDHHGR